MSRVSVLVSVTLVVIVAAVLVTTRKAPDVMMEQPEPSGMMEKPDPSGMMEPSPSAMMKASPEAMQDGAGMEKSRASVAEYSQAAYDAAVASGRPVALYFYANWCPVCKVEFPKFEAAVQTQESGALAAFRVSYNDSDTSAEETAAAKAFQVGYQHTLVLIKNGSVISKELVSGQTQAEYETRLESAL